MWSTWKTPVPTSPPRAARRFRAALVPVAALGLALFVWLSIQVYRSKTDPEGYRAWDGPHAWIIGPPATELADAADVHIRDGLEILNDTSRAPSERIQLYKEKLKRAEALLIRSLRAQPAQAPALAALAAVRWELDPPLTPAAVEAHLELIELASAMAPTYPEVQKRLGELLLNMGRRVEALEYLSRAVALDPGLSREVILVLRENLFSAEEMFEALPRRVEVLVQLDAAYREESKQIEYLALLESALGRGIDPSLLRRYGRTCMHLGDPARLLGFLDGLGALTDVAAEGERLGQRSRALAALGRAGDALADARRARELQPALFPRAEQLGDVALTSGDAVLALSAYRDALGIVSKTSAGKLQRSRLYRKIGVAEEQRGRTDLAYDAYRRALELNPEETKAAERVAEMQRAAGFE